MLDRRSHLLELQHGLRRSHVVGILGPRQVGKTTLARQLAARKPTTWFDLEDPADLARLSDPMLALRRLTGLVVIDEVQRMPELFAPLRVLADRPRGARFLLLGSASPELVKQSSESLAGRIEYLQLGGFSLDEVGIAHWPRLWLRGGFPRSYTARSDRDSAIWRRDFVRTFLERDIRYLTDGASAATLERLWTMLAHWHGQILNMAELARALAVSEPTIRRYLDILEGTFMIRLLKPWHENLAKRQVRSPKVYLSDSGLLHTLLGLDTRRDLDRHPKVGASWEGFALEQILAHLRADAGDCYFWATHQQAELDLLVVRGNSRRGFELKLADAPTVTPSMRIALADLKLDSLDVVHAGEQTYPLADRIRAVSIDDLMTAIQP
ncbi:MAG TPA: ATP-binding protein [Kofleriaceae bacterium]